MIDITKVPFSVLLGISLSSNSDYLLQLDAKEEYTNHLGNVLTVISDRKIAVESTTTPGTIDYFLPDVLSANDYYSFGGIMPNRSFNSNSYKYGFNGKERDNEIVGTSGGTYDYGFRIYNPSLGRFLSVDPLSRSYPFFTPYQFAANKPITGIDLDGLEYLDFRESRIKMIGGDVHINLVNFNETTRNAWQQRNNTTPSPDGNLGWSTKVTSITYVENPVAKAESASLDPTYDPDVNTSLNSTYLNTKIGGVRIANSTGKEDMRFNAAKVNAAGGVKTGTGSARIPGTSASITGGQFAVAALVLNAINWGMEQKQIWDTYEDQTLVEKHKSILFNQVLADITKAIEQGMIDQKYRTTSDLAAIANVVLFGAQSENKELNEIGWKIVKEISKNFKGKPTTTTTDSNYNPSNPSDNTSTKPVIVQNVQQD